jgi:FAD:protein FMN transferase
VTVEASTTSTWTFDAIGTAWEIETEEPLCGSLRQEIAARIERFDRTYSRFRPDSLVSRIAHAADGGRFAFPEDGAVLFDFYDRLASATNGAVDPLVGRRLELLGYDPGYSLVPVPAVELAREPSAWARDVVRDGPTLVTRRPVVIDVGAAGKGYLVDIIAALLRGAGIGRFVVDASGDLRHHGADTVRVGLQHPYQPRQVIGVADLHERALCASATTRRAWGDGLHHVIDARTGRPVRDVVATWVVADTALLADGLATALFMTGATGLAEQFRFSYVRMFTDGRAQHSHDFAGELFTA